nr:PREDICTED: inward rectifier potassium channel 13-like [Paralichthys olivaceus]
MTDVDEGVADDDTLDVDGAFVAKIARPQKRAGAIQFSPQAVVGQHQGQMCLMLRATNLLQQPLVDVKSPLYPALCEGTSNHFELVVFLSALQEGTGDSCQKRTSYLRHEIQFDRCFVPALGMDARGRYMVSTQHFDTAHSKEPFNKDCAVQINGDGSDRME